MKPELKDVIHHYLGCELSISMFPDILEHVEEGEAYPKLFFVGLDPTDIGEEYQIELRGVGYETNLYVPIEQIKPTLRRRSSMTEEEYKEFRELFEGATYDSMNYERAKMGIVICLDFEQMATSTNWLRKKGFDIDGLIDAGLAVDRKEVL